jgi:two-component system, LytTR family, response regulator
MQLRALVVDDEPLARKSLRLLLSKHHDVSVAGEASHGREALALIRREKPDLLFLDVQMPGMSGLEVLRKLGAFDSMAVVFVTAYDSYAIQAFERRALDYLLKPYTDERFEQVLSRAKQHIKDRALTELGSKVLDMLGDAAVAQPFRARDAEPKRNTLLIKDGQRTIALPVADIDWIEATDYYARVHAGAKSWLIRESLKSLAATLDPGMFVRAHRSAIVNVARVAELTPHPSGDAVAMLTGGDCVRVSRTFRSSLLSRVSLQRSSSR